MPTYARSSPILGSSNEICIVEEHAVTTRRNFLSLIATAATAPRAGWAQTSSGKLVLYASVGPELFWYDINVAAGTLTRRGSVTLPANVQYAWPHVSRRYLYVTSSDSASGIGGFVGKTHHASALRIDPASGALTPHVHRRHCHHDRYTTRPIADPNIS